MDASPSDARTSPVSGVLHQVSYSNHMSAAGVDVHIMCCCMVHVKCLHCITDAVSVPRHGCSSVTRHRACAMDRTWLSVSSVTCEDAEGGGLAGAVEAQQPEALPAPDAQPQPRHRTRRRLRGVRLARPVQQHLPPRRLRACTACDSGAGVALRCLLWSVGFTYNSVHNLILSNSKSQTVWYAYAVDDGHCSCRLLT
jgi:hypothetical protein